LLSFFTFSIKNNGHAHFINEFRFNGAFDYAKKNCNSPANSHMCVCSTLWPRLTLAAVCALFANRFRLGFSSSNIIISIIIGSSVCRFFSFSAVLCLELPTFSKHTPPCIHMAYVSVCIHSWLARRYNKSRVCAQLLCLASCLMIRLCYNLYANRLPN